ncbi:MAG TPA: serine/threonine-protein kinase [Terriglobales bacterium]|nr:serine/threonine-protein kinase [Terriglobales bacterium]
MDDRRSERFGRYEILTELGRGAMGVVYKARDPKINRVVAVKTVSLAGQPPEEEREYRERFFREAEAAGRLSHPGIVTIFDVGEEPETRVPYIVMEFVGGQSLDKLLSRDDHKLPVETALQLALELAEALDCAHGQGVVHRDLKPANILLTEDGHAKIADFGVAKLNLANHTLAGRAYGTPAYMSPEQLNGEAVDGRSDLFSLGVILYTVLTGYRPFQGNSALTVSFKVVNHEPMPATVLDTELPQGLDHIITRAMAKDPAERYQSGEEMVQDIQKLREGRELLSKTKAKLPGLPAGGSAPQTVAAKPQPSALSLLPWHGAAGKLLEQIRERSVAGVLVLVGLFILGLWAISFGPQGVRSRAAEHLPLAGEVATDKTAATPTDPAAPLTSIAKAPAPIEEKLSKPVPAGRTHPSSTKVARASSPTVSPVASPATSAATSPATAPATLEIEVEHRFVEAQLSIWVDDRLTYTHQLAGTDKKHLVVFHHVQGHEFHAMQVSPGKHSLKVQVTSNGAAYDQSATAAGQFVSGQESVLRINFSKHGEINLSLQ